MTELAESYIPVAEAIRSFAEPHWHALHKEMEREFDLEIPEIASTHRCRETSLVAQRALEAAGAEGWRVQAGQVLFIDYEDVPEDILQGDDDMDTAAHTWLVNEELGLRIDLTADQFGQVQGAVIEPLEAGDDYEDADEDIDWMEDVELAVEVERWSSGEKFAALVDQLREIVPRAAPAMAP